MFQDSISTFQRNKTYFFVINIPQTTIENLVIFSGGWMETFSKSTMSCVCNKKLIISLGHRRHDKQESRIELLGVIVCERSKLESKMLFGTFSITKTIRNWNLIWWTRYGLRFLVGGKRNRKEKENKNISKNQISNVLQAQIESPEHQDKH